VRKRYSKALGEIQRRYALRKNGRLFVIVQQGARRPELLRLGSRAFPPPRRCAAVAVVGNTSGPPKWIRPQLTRVADEAPAGDDWLHEIKYDGYRMHARLADGKPHC
jgi:ATP-dependent DNA ligase